MRKLIVVALCLTLSVSYGQGFYKGKNDDECKALIEGGLHYVLTGDSIFDLAMKNALKSKWNSTEYTILEKGEKPTKGCYLGRLSMSETATFSISNSDVLVILPSTLYGKSVSKYKAVGYMYFNGFNTKVKKNEEYVYVDLIIGALNDGINTIQEHKISAGGVVLYKLLSAGVDEDNISVKDKRLILHKSKKEHIVPKYMEKLGVKYKVVDTEEFNKLIEEKNTDDYFLHFAYNSYTDISVVSAASSEMIFQKHFAGGYGILKGKELKAVATHF